MAAGNILRDILDGLGVGFKGRFWSMDTSNAATAASFPEFVQVDPITGDPVDATGTVNVAQDTSSIKNGVTSLTPKFAPIAISASGDLVALVSGKKIRVLSLWVIVTGDVTVKFQTGAATDLTGAMALKAGGGIVLPFTPVGHFETASGAKLNAVLGGSVGVSGGLTYIEV